MRNYFFLLFCLAGCAQKNESVSVPAPAPVIKEAKLENPFLAASEHQTAELQKFAGWLLENGESLDLATAEKCVEDPRAEISGLCALLWSGEKSEILPARLTANFAKSRLWAVAAVKQKKILASLIFSQLLALLERLEREPDWLRIEAAESWLHANPPLPLVGKKQLLDELLKGTPQLPEDFRARRRFFAENAPPEAENLLQSYCNASVKGDLRIRCWRFLSALEKKPEILPWLPSPEDRSWKLFRLAFPLRAYSLEQPGGYQ